MKKPAATTKEERLAQALRANLRRRKAQAQSAGVKQSVIGQKKQVEP